MVQTFTNNKMYVIQKSTTRNVLSAPFVRFQKIQSKIIYTSVTTILLPYLSLPEMVNGTNVFHFPQKECVLCMYVINIRRNFADKNVKFSY